jgi:hypothetical protein
MNGGSGKEREERAVDALLISGLRPMGDKATDVAAKNLPELTDEERAAMKALGGNFIQRLLAGERPLGPPPAEADEECPEECSEECDELALAGSGADTSLNRAEEVDDETAKELDEREREILERKARERKERGGDGTT